ncbi:MAG: hypothetical protein OEV99_14815 [Nitrospira sp.]|nr:hypothetical protein [Nitrospira sp.]MDH4371094.1 hypothetical protein [Nitrospira sp.]MDH5348170.1 hypothetical protein [Nitrospira sp.]MDH5497768.1 hypothetical protein [Nitrospira sp.]MDH5726244.1 hypothetical protein [Nitrospira sp.]
MASPEQPVVTTDRLTDLERTVAAMDNQLRTILWGLQRSHSGSLRKRLWSFVRPNPNAEFMSAVCNQRVRSNTKLMTHERSRT